MILIGIFNGISKRMLCSLKRNMKSFNIDGINRTGNPIVNVKARNSTGAGSMPDDNFQSLQNNLPLAKNTKVVLTANLWPDAKLVNGTTGTIK